MYRLGDRGQEQHIEDCSLSKAMQLPEGKLLETDQRMAGLFNCGATWGGRAGSLTLWRDRGAAWMNSSKIGTICPFTGQG
jgi:hypothetical protein